MRIVDRLIKFELSKLFHSVSFYVCGACLLVLSVLGELMLMFAETLFGNLTFKDLADYGLYSGTICLVKASSMGNLPMLLGIFISISICSEYSGKTFKNVWSRGFSRMQTFIAKTVVACVAALIYVVSMMFVCFLFASILCGVGKELTRNEIGSINVQICIVLAIACFFVMIAFVFKRRSIAVVIAVMAPSLLTIGSTAIDYMLQLKNIDYQVSELIITNQLTLVSMSFDNVVLAKGFLVAVGYIVSSVVLGYMGMKNDEI